MIGGTRALRVWAYPAPADLRKGFDGLAGLVTTQLTVIVAKATYTANRIEF